MLACRPTSPWLPPLSTLVSADATTASQAKAAAGRAAELESELAQHEELLVARLEEDLLAAEGAGGGGAAVPLLDAGAEGGGGGGGGASECGEQAMVAV